MNIGFRGHRIFGAAALLVGFSLVLAAPVFAQDKQAESGGKAEGKKEAVTDKAKSGPQGTDSNIKNDSDKNDPKAQIAAPPNKGGKSRGAGPYPCGVHVDNRTPWLIRIYVDGAYRGAVGSYGDVA